MSGWIGSTGDVRSPVSGLPFLHVQGRGLSARIAVRTRHFGDKRIDTVGISDLAKALGLRLEAVST